MGRKYNLHVSEAMWRYWQREIPNELTESGLFRPRLVRLTRRHWWERRIVVGDMVQVRGQGLIFRVAERYRNEAVVVPNCSNAPGDERSTMGEGYSAFFQYSRRSKDAKEHGGEAYLYKKCDPDDNRGPAYWAATDGTPEPLTSS